MSNIRRKHPVIAMNATAFRDERLSWKAKGLMAYLLDKISEGAPIEENEDIFKASTDGQTSVRAGLKELQKYGYLVRVGFRKNNKMSHYTFFIHEQPVAYPSDKPIYVDYDAWEDCTDISDITLFVKYREICPVKSEKRRNYKILSSPFDNT